MWPDRVSNPGLLTYESSALSTALRDPAQIASNCSQLHCSTARNTANRKTEFPREIKIPTNALDICEFKKKSSKFSE